MTTKQTLRQLAAAGKQVTVQQLYRYFNKLEISPSGAPQRPQQYPEDTAQRILQHLGLVPAPLAPEVTAASVLGKYPPLETPAVRAALPRTRLLSNTEINAARPLPRSKPSTKGKK